MTADDATIRRPRGVLLVLGATVISAASSFLVLLIVAPALGPAEYAIFSVYWSALFMIVGVLFGVQQEGTRAVAALGERRPNRSASLITFAAVLGGVLLLLIATTGFAWGAPLFGAGNGTWVFPLAVAVAAYALVAALNGVLAGRGAWSSFALLPIIDGLLRLVLVVIVLWLGWGASALVWAVAIPFPVSLVVVGVLARGETRGHTRVSGSYTGLSMNTGRTMLASASTALLVNGFPLVLSIFGGADEATLGAVVLALMLTRAPILVPLTALQSMLIARFSSDAGSRGKFLSLVIGALILVTGVVAVFVFFLGEWLLRTFFGNGFALDGALLGGLVAAAGCLGILTATGAAVLAADRHTIFALGWLIASVVSILVVALVPGELGTRTVLALAVGPLIGAAVHAAALFQASGAVHTPQAVDA